MKNFTFAAYNLKNMSESFTHRFTHLLLWRHFHTPKHEADQNKTMRFPAIHRFFANASLDECPLDAHFRILLEVGGDQGMFCLDVL